MDASACPDEEQLTRLAEGLLPADEAAVLGAHTESCSSCRRLVALLMKLRSQREGSQPTVPSPEPAPAIALGSTLGRYVVRRFVGSGAMGVVFEAEDPALQRRVAVKVMRSAQSAPAQALLQREAQVMAQLSHRNVATVFDVGVVDGRSWVAMEFIEGPTLRAWLQREPRAEAAILARLLEAGRGLAAAHAAGVVHRDFKPDNVLVEQSSARVVVTDFGLSAGSSEVTASPTKSVVGTPAYMAPEQRLGDANAASDQFAFCVTAVEAFTGKRPFESGALDAQVLARVPRRMRAALTRGLAVEPSARWPSLEALLHALTPPRRERQVLAAAAMLSVVAVGAAGTASYRRAHVCDGAGATVQTVWNAEARAKFQAAFLATGLPFAQVSADGVSAELDEWASRWSAHATQVCGATELRHTQSGELMDLRRECLDDRLRELRAVTSALSHADAAMVKNADAIGQRLTPLSECDDEKALRAPVRLPASPPLALRVAAVRDLLASASALRVTSQLEAAQAAMPALEKAALEAGHRPLEAEVLVQAGLLASEREDYAAAGKKLQGALVAAQAGGHTLAAAQAWVGLTLLEGVHLGHPAEGHRAAELAAAASERLGRPAALEAQLATNLGTLSSSEGKHEEAKASYDAALAHYRELGADTLSLAQALNAVGAQEQSLGQPDAALAHHTEALALVTKTYGPVHEEVATTLINLGDVQLARKDFAASVKSYEQAIEVTEKTSGPHHANLADCWGGLAFPLMELKEWERALAATDKAQAIYAGSKGQPYPEGLVHFAHARALWEVVPARRPEAKAEAAAARASLEKVGAQPEELAEIDAWLRR